MKSIGEAMREIAAGFEPLAAVRRPLQHALGCALALDVIASRDLPGFDNSAMDGYAVRRADLAPELALPVIGESRAGGPWPEPLRAGSVTRIFTGAPVPEGADTVVIQEHVERDGDAVRFTRLPEAGANVRARGSDLRAGARALAAGQHVGPGEIGLLAALGRHAVTVVRPPRVAILSTGDELRDIGEDQAPGSLVNSNAYALAAAVAQAGAEPWVLPPVPDDDAAIANALEQALQADAVLSTGGVSVGEHDRVADAFARAGVAVRFWKVAIKPGKPLLFGTRGRVPVVGLPGNPVSALVAFEVFVRAGLRRMAGHAAPYPALIQVELDHDHRHGTGRTELARAALRSTADGRWLAQLHRLQGSGSLPSLSGADALVVLDADQERFARGSALLALLLPPVAFTTAPALP
jgi:molybdopterin molybdotransferase